MPPSASPERGPARRARDARGRAGATARPVLRRVGRVVGLTGALVLGLLAPGCTACTAGTDGSAPGALPAGVTVAVTQQRADVADRQAEVQIRNDGTTPIAVGAVRLDDPRFAGPATRVVDRVSPVAPGATVDIRVQLPGPVCDGRSGAPAVVTVAFEVDGRTGEGSAAAAELFPFLDALHRRDCIEEAVRAAAEVGFSGLAPSADRKSVV